MPPQCIKFNNSFQSSQINIKCKQGVTWKSRIRYRAYNFTEALIVHCSMVQKTGQTAEVDECYL